MKLTNNLTLTSDTAGNRQLFLIFSNTSGDASQDGARSQRLSSQPEPRPGQSTNNTPGRPRR
jgi:hypothetical protein